MQSCLSVVQSTDTTSEKLTHSIRISKFSRLFFNFICFQYRKIRDALSNIYRTTRQRRRGIIIAYNIIIHTAAATIIIYTLLRLKVIFKINIVLRLDRHYICTHDGTCV